MSKLLQSGPSTASEWWASLGLTDEQSDRAAAHILQQVRCAKDQWVQLLMTIMLFIGWLLLAVIADAAPPTTALQAMVFNLLDWAIAIIVTMASGTIIFIQWGRNRLQRNLFAQTNFSPYAEKELQRYIQHIDISVLRELPAYILWGRV